MHTSRDDISCLSTSRQVPFHENIDYMTDDHIDVYQLYQCWSSNKSAQDDISVIIPSSQSKRLENACWRRWYKTMHGLKSSHPVVINWRKDQDITWLYGPKYNGRNRFDISTSSSTRTNQHSEDYLKLTASNLSHHSFQKPHADDDDSCSVGSGASSLSLDESETDSLSDITLSNSEDEFVASVSSQAYPNNKLHLVEQRDEDDGYEEDEEEDEYVCSLRSSLKRSPRRSFSLPRHDALSSLKSAQDKVAYNKRPIHKRDLKTISGTGAASATPKKNVKFNYIINSREIINGMNFDYDFLDESCL